MVTIIGAGPAGSYAAGLLAKKYDVDVYEEHSKIGSPVQCAGIVTSALADIINLRKDFIINFVDRAKIFYGNEFLEVKLKKRNIILDRAKFDKYLAEKAIDNGARYYTGFKFINCSLGKKIIVKLDKKELETNILIGADGPFSSVARKCGMYGKRRFVFGLQSRIKSKFDPGLVEFYLNYGCFGWVIPEDNKVARVGVVAYDKVKEHFDLLLKKVRGRIINYQSGIIPFYNPKLKIQCKNVFLIGDAATQVKALTFGGLIPGLIAAGELSKSFENYEINFKRRLGKELWLNLFLRKMLDKFNEKDYIYFIHLFNQDKLKGIIGDYDRDYVSKFLFKLLLKEPRLLYFTKFML